MARTPKSKGGAADAGPRAARPPLERTSAVVAGTMILLTVTGVLTVFWEPLTALAQGGDSAATGPLDEMEQTRLAPPDAGALPAAASDASGNS